MNTREPISYGRLFMAVGVCEVLDDVRIRFSDCTRVWTVDEDILKAYDETLAAITKLRRVTWRAAVNHPDAPKGGGDDT